MKFKDIKKKIRKKMQKIGLIKKFNLFSFIKNRYLRVRPLSILLVVVMLVVASVYFLFFFSSDVLAEWWDTNWHYRKAITITNSGSAQTDFQVKVLFNYDMSIDVTNGKVQADFDDLRFTDINGNALDYWIEDDTSTSLDVWVKISSIPTNTSTVYMYYGNANASSTQSGDDTFEFFDDFENNSLDANKWHSYADGNNGYSFSDGVIRIWRSDYTPIYTKEEFSNDGLLVMSRIKRIASGDFDSGIWFSYNGGTGTGMNNGIGNFLDDAGNGHHCGICYPGWSTIPTYFTGAIGVDTWEDIEIWRNGNTVYASAFGETISATITDQTVNPIGLFSDGDDYTRSAFYEYIAIRKYITTIPTATVQSEEKGPGPVGYWSFDEGYGTTAQDRTSNNNDGTITGATWQTEDMCVSRKCLYFDGSSTYVNIPDNNSLDFGTDDFTITLWAKINSGASLPIALVGKNVGVSQGYHFYIHGATGNVLYGYFNDGTGDYVQLTTNDLRDNTWHFFVFSRNNGLAKVEIVDKGLSNTKTITKNIDTNQPFYIGGQTQGNMDGFIDEVKIYPYARTAAQIKADYASAGSARGAAAALGSPSTGSGQLSSGLIGYWKMDEGSGNAVDSSGNGNTGTWNGTGSHYPAGKYGNGGGFNGSDDYVNITENYNSAKTLSFWIYSDNWGNFIPISKGVRFGYFQYIGGLRFYAPTNTLTVNFGALSNKWYHCTLVVTGTQHLAYLNGELVGSPVNSALALFTGGDNLYLGKFSGGGYMFNGKIDEVRIYNRALSEREVKALYEWAPGPVGHWKMDEKSGVAAYDTSGNGNTGTITGATWTSGKYGGGLNFSSSLDTKVRGNISPAVIASGKYTQEAWMYPTAAVPGTIIDDYNNAEHYISRNSTGTIRVNYYDNPGGVPTHVYAQTTQTVPLNQWTHVAGTVDSGNFIKVYINGVLVAENTSLGGVQSRILNDFAIGQYGGGLNKFNGLIDDVRIYNYARTQKQILEDMLAGRPAQKSPVGYWSFDTGYGAVAQDSSGYGNNGTITGADWTNEGKFGKALSFNGSSVNIGNPASGILDFGANQDFTLSTWFYLDSLPSAWESIINKGASGGDGYGMEISSSNKFTCSIDADGGTNQHVSSSDAPNTGEWLHGTCVFDRDGDVTGYINGEQVLQSSISGNSASLENSTSFAIGSYSSNWFFNGTIDEVKVFNYALTEEEIRQEYNQGKVSVMGVVGGDGGGSTSSAGTAEYCVSGSSDACDPPVAEWKFEEHAGTYAYDSSGNGNTGTLTNMEESDWTVGKIGGALDFDGENEYIGTPSFGFDYNYITIEAWINAKALAERMNIFGSSNLTTCPALEIYPGGSIRLGLNGVWGPYTIAGVISTGNWYHIVYTKNGTGNQHVIYVNGVAQTLAYNPTLEVAQTVTTHQVGSRTTGIQRFNGLIDQVRIYDYARTPAQVAWDYNKGKPVAHYKMDKGEGTIIYDSSGNGNNGTLELGALGQTSAGSVKVNANTAWYNGRQGKQNYSLNFDGDDDGVEVAYDSIFDMKSDEVTISAWVNMLSGGNRFIFEKTVGDTVNTGYSLFFENSNTTLRIEGCGDLDYASQPSTGIWHSIVAVNSPSGLGNFRKIYIDGKEVISSTGCTMNEGVGISVMGKHASDGYYFDGQIDEVKIFNYALSPLQIKTEYNQGAAQLGSFGGKWGSSELWAGTSCNSIKQSRPTAPDGTYWINPEGGESPFQVYCDMTTDGGGWTLVSTKVSYNFIPWSSSFNSACAVSTNSDCASKINPDMTWTTAMWRFADTDSYILKFDKVDHSGFASYLEGTSVNSHPTVTLSKIVNGVHTGKTAVASWYHYYTSGISESHGSSDQWGDMWNSIDSTNNYNYVESSNMRGTKCITGYCKEAAIWLMVR